MDSVKVLPCRTCGVPKYSVAINGKFHWENNAIWCGTEAEALEKAAELRGECPECGSDDPAKTRQILKPIPQSDIPIDRDCDNKFHEPAQTRTPAPACSQPERDKQILAALEDESIVYYGPHLCDLCGTRMICKTGNGYQPTMRFDYPGDIVYPNHNWTVHRCPPKPICICDKSAICPVHTAKNSEPVETRPPAPGERMDRVGEALNTILSFSGRRPFDLWQQRIALPILLAIADADTPSENPEPAEQAAPPRPREHPEICPVCQSPYCEHDEAEQNVIKKAFEAGYAALAAAAEPAAQQESGLASAALDAYLLMGVINAGGEQKHVLTVRAQLGEAIKTYRARQAEPAPTPSRSWGEIIRKVNLLMGELRNKPLIEKIGFQLSPGGILNAYREGDLNFEEAAELLSVKPDAA